MDKQGYKRQWYTSNRERILVRLKRNRESRNFDSMRQAVLQRDDYTCQRCKRHLGETHLTVHHKDRTGRGSEEHNNDLDNLETLCRACHCREHHAELLEIRRRNSQNRWSLKYRACIECGTTNVPYGGRGRCDNCYAKYLRANHTGKWARQYDACIHCHTTNFPHSGKGLCSSCAPRLRREAMKMEKI